MTISYSVVLKYDYNERGQKWNRVLSTWSTSKAADEAARIWRELTPDFARLIEVLPLEAHTGIPVIYFGAQLTRVDNPQSGYRLDLIFDVGDTLPRDKEERSRKGNIKSVTVWADSLENRTKRISEILKSKEWETATTEIKR
jgi:hypothetical protein